MPSMGRLTLPFCGLVNNETKLPPSSSPESDPLAPAILEEKHETLPHPDHISGQHPVLTPVERTRQFDLRPVELRVPRTRLGKQAPDRRHAREHQQASRPFVEKSSRLTRRLVGHGDLCQAKES